MTKKAAELTEKITLPTRPAATVWAAADTLAFRVTDAKGQSQDVPIKLNLCRPPVIFVHGFTGDKTTWGKFAEELTGKKWHTNVDLYYHGDQAIKAQSQGLGRNIKALKNHYGTSGLKLSRVNVVAHSMGGLITRYYIARVKSPIRPDGYGDDVRKLIMVGTPNHGCSLMDKWIGRTAALLQKKHYKAARELYCDSLFMRALNNQEKAGRHLNRDVQYANIIGKREETYSYRPYPDSRRTATGTRVVNDDGVVTVSSAQLNGVKYVFYNGMIHSTAVASIYKGNSVMTLDERVWDKVQDFLTRDIPFEKLRYVSVICTAAKGGTAANAATAVRQAPIRVGQDLHRSRIQTKAGESLTLEIRVNDRPRGRVTVFENSLLMIWAVSTGRTEVRMLKGKAQFTSIGENKRVFRVFVYKRQKRDTIVPTGLRTIIVDRATDFAVDAGEKIQVYALEGEVIVEPNKPDADKPARPVMISTGQGLAIEQGKPVQTVAVPEKGFWTAKAPSPAQVPPKPPTTQPTTPKPTPPKPKPELKDYTKMTALPRAADAEFVRSLFRCILHREVTPPVLASLTKRLGSGTKRSQIIMELFESAEYKDRKTNDCEYLLDLYQAILGREPREGEADPMVEFLRKGGSRMVSMSNLFATAEYRGLKPSSPK